MDRRQGCFVGCFCECRALPSPPDPRGSCRQWGEGVGKDLEPMVTLVVLDFSTFQPRAAADSSL